MKFAQFYVNDQNGEPTEKLGSEGVLVLDGRWGYTKAMNEAERVGTSRNKNLNAGIVGFKIMQGERFSKARSLTNGQMHKI